MNRFVAPSGKVSHILTSVTGGDEEGRVVHTLCGKSFDEVSLSIDNDADECSTCNKKFESAVESVSDTVLPE